MQFHSHTLDSFPEGKDLLTAVRARFIANGTTLNKWCKENGLCRQWVTDTLTGKGKGPAARAMRKRVVSELSNVPA